MGTLHGRDKKLPIYDHANKAKPVIKAAQKDCSHYTNLAHVPDFRPRALEPSDSRPAACAWKVILIPFRVHPILSCQWRGAFRAASCTKPCVMGTTQTYIHWGLKQFTQAAQDPAAPDPACGRLVFKLTSPFWMASSRLSSASGSWRNRFLKVISVLSTPGLTRPSKAADLQPNALF